MDIKDTSIVMDINQEVQERNASASVDDNLEKGEIYTNSKKCHP